MIEKISFHQLLVWHALCAVEATIDGGLVSASDYDKTLLDLSDVFNISIRRCKCI
jgi:hypothetical protein